MAENIFDMYFESWGEKSCYIAFERLVFYKDISVAVFTITFSLSMENVMTYTIIFSLCLYLKDKDVSNIFLTQAICLTLDLIFQMSASLQTF